MALFVSPGSTSTQQVEQVKEVIKPHNNVFTFIHVFLELLNFQLSYTQEEALIASLFVFEIFYLKPRIHNS